MKVATLLLLLAITGFPQTVQTDATWGIARISHRDWQYPLSSEYLYDATGQGVRVYVVDTGVLITHPDFEGRASSGWSINGKKFNATCNNHGTHVAGTVGSHTYGVAKQVTIVSVRVAPCQGAVDPFDIIDGLNWIATQPRGVVNLSFANSILSGVVQNLVNRGFVVVVAAGNGNTDACNYWGNSPGALVVAATDNRDYRSETSNFGSCVDIYAPGVNILSTWNNGSWGVLSGTSTAAPHVAGVASLYLEQHPSASPQEVHDAVVNNATQGILTDATPNIFLYSLF